MHEEPAEIEGVVQLMYDYGATTPLWDEGGLLPEDPDWLHTALGISAATVEAVTSWGTRAERIFNDRSGLSRAEERAEADRLRAEGEELAERIRAELRPGPVLEYRPW